MTQNLFDSQILDPASWPAAPIALDSLLRLATPGLDGIAGLFAFGVLAILAIGWLTAIRDPRPAAGARGTERPTHPARTPLPWSACAIEGPSS